MLRIDLEVNLGSRNKIKKHLFRFEEAWSRDKKCESSVRVVWNSIPGNGVSKILDNNASKIISKNTKLVR